VTTLLYNALSVDLHPLGARTSALRFHGRDFILPVPDSFEPDGPRQYCGAIVGPVANRVTTGPHVPGWTGPAGEVLLHGDGADLRGGLHHRTWRLTRAGHRHACFSCTLDAGSDGFAANREITVSYSLPRANVLNIVIEARTDAPTVMGPTHHPYWALGEGPGTAGHRLQVLADHVLPIDSATRPTGDVHKVAGTPRDFNIPTSLTPGRPALDNCFCLASARTRVKRPAAYLEAPDGWAMELWTTEPGLVVFDGRHTESFGLAPYAGCALEPQSWPDAPRHSHFPKITLLPGTLFRSEIEYRFKVGSGRMREGGTSRGL